MSLVSDPKSYIKVTLRQIRDRAKDRRNKDINLEKKTRTKYSRPWVGHWVFDIDLT